MYYIADKITHYCNISLPYCAEIDDTIAFYDFTFMLDGHMTYIANGREYVIGKNDAIFFSPGTVRQRKRGNTPVSYVSFNFTSCADELQALPEYIPSCITSSMRKIISAFPQNHLTPNFHSEQKCANILNYILFELIDSSSFVSGNEHIRKIVTFIDEHIRDNISLGMVSAHVNLSKEYTSAIFQKEMHITLTDYINTKKLDVAKELILGREMSLSDVAAYVGFENYNYFSRIFKRHFGVSPQNMKKFR